MFTPSPLGKKGNIFDALQSTSVVGILTFVFLVVGVILYKFGVNAAALAKFSFTEGQSVATVAQTFPTYIDWVYPFLFFALLIISMFLAYKTPSSSGLFIVAMFSIPFVMFLIIIFSKLIQTAFESGVFSVVTGQMPITTFMLSGINPLLTSILYMMLTFIALYAGKNE